MNTYHTLNLFYQEPEKDRWFRFDRYPRKLLRVLLRGKPRPGGQMMVAINLIKGLERLGIPYRFNDFGFIRRNPVELACIIGKPNLLFERTWANPILFGAAVYSHPIDCPNLFQRYPNVKKILVPGEWMRKMCEPYYGDKVFAWPVGIDTNLWVPEKVKEEVDFLVYCKFLWDKEKNNTDFLMPLLQILESKKLSYKLVKYGSYDRMSLKKDLSVSKAAIFLCEHETQGLGYQQLLSSNLPVLAWDREGDWLDPEYYPHKVQYGPVSSVPYWDSRCGLKFKGLDDFEKQLSKFYLLLEKNAFSPREFILDNLTLEKCALEYYEHALSCSNG